MGVLFTAYLADLSSLNTSLFLYIALTLCLPPLLNNLFLESKLTGQLRTSGQSVGEGNTL